MKYRNIIFAVLFALSWGTVNAAQEEGRTKHDVWSGFWWQTKGGLILKPLEKYDSLAGVKTVAWEKANRPANTSLPDWDGLCHGWSASAVLETEPRSTLRIQQQTLYVGDQKGWFAVAHAGDVANFYGDRFGDGVGSEDPQDLPPDELWQILRRYIKEKKTPLVFDLDAGDAIWNYPAYAYRVKYQPVSAGSNVHQGTIELWCADDGVAVNFVGLKSYYKKYHFQVEMKNNSIVMGTGKWLGNSVKDHPDFAWFPYVVRSGNPELKYETVCRLLNRNTVTPPRPINVAGNVTVSPDTNPAVNPVVNPNTTPPVVTQPALPEDTLTLPELYALLEGKASNFFSDASAEVFDGKYIVGETLKIKVISDENGYLYLFGKDKDGNLAVLYPLPGDDNKIESKKLTTVPADTASYEWKLTVPYGDFRIRSLVTEKPLNFSGQYVTQSQTQQRQIQQQQTQGQNQTVAAKKTQAEEQKKQTFELSELFLRVLPAEQQQIQQNQAQKITLDKLPVSVGRFSQDEVLIYVDKK